jgi:hypothetical protein
VAIAELEGSGISVPDAGGPGRFDSGCGAFSVGGVPARVAGKVATLESGRPLRFSGCGSVTLPAGESSVTAPPGTVFRADHVRLASAAPRPAPATRPGRVVDSGNGWNGKRDGVRLDLASPAWLVLAEGWSKGWRAFCTAGGGGGERDLGDPVPLDGFATAWRAPAGCASARFEFRPQRLATGAYVVSALAAGLMLLVLLSLLVASRGRAATGSDPQIPARARDASLGLTRDPLIRLPWRYALAAGLALGLAGGFVFALRAGAVLAPLTVLALRAGVSVRRLLTAAAVLLAALPVVYILFPARDRGGNEFSYSDDLLGAHWIAVLAVLCLLGAGLLLAVRLRRASASGSRSST